MDTKSALVLLHGALGSKDQFAPLTAHLKDSFNIYSLNFEGHGGRKSERGFSIDHFVENALELMEREEICGADIFGFSMGGYVALKLALQHPQKVGKIMTLGTKFQWTAETANKEVSRLNPLKMEEKVPQLAEQLKKRHAPLDWHQVLSKTGEMMLELGKSASLETEDFENVQCPTLICLGSEDRMVSEKESRQVATAIPEGSFHVFEGFKHPLEQVDTRKLGAKIKEFFGQAD